MIFSRYRTAADCVPRRIRSRLKSPSSGNGFTLVEVMVGVVLLGVGISAVIYGMGVSNNTTNEGRLVLVSGDLAAYFKQYTKSLAFSEPGSGESVFGPEAGEVGLDDYDDIDDLNGLVLSPPILADGSVQPSFAGWSQHVTVTVIDPETLAEIQPQKEAFAKGVVAKGVFAKSMEAKTQPEEEAILKRVEVEIYIGSRRMGLYQWIMTDR